MIYHNAKEALEKWEVKANLKEIESKHIKNIIALLIENQSLWNEGCAEGPRKYLQENFHEVIKMIFHPKFFLGFDLISVQMMLGPTGIIYSSLGELHSDEVVARTRKLKAYPWPQDYIVTPPNCETSFDSREAVCHEITNEFNREIISDLRNNAGTVINIKKDELHRGIEKMRGCIQEKTNDYSPNWIICAPEEFNLLTGKDSYVERENVPGLTLTRHEWKDYKVIIDPLFPSNMFLMGYKGDGPYDSPYIYAPYITYMGSPEIISEDFCPRPGIMTRYAKRLTVDGAKYFGRIVIKKD
jgi:hypothetical protein